MLLTASFSLKFTAFSPYYLIKFKSLSCLCRRVSANTFLTSALLIGLQYLTAKFSVKSVKYDLKYGDCLIKLIPGHKETWEQPICNIFVNFSK